MKILALCCLLICCFYPNHCTLQAQQVAIVDLDSICWMLWEPAEQMKTQEQYRTRRQANQNQLDTISAEFHKLYDQLINDPKNEQNGTNPIIAGAKRRSHEQLNDQLAKKFEALRQQQKAVLLQELTQANREQYKLVVEKSSLLYLAEDEFSGGSAPLQFSKRMIALMTEEQLEKLVPCQKLVPKY